jgi:hypothetical protein
VQNYKYNVFGLNILSSISIPEMSETSFAKEDVRIVIGKNPPRLSIVRDSGVLFQANSNQFLFSFDNVGSIHVKDGKLITVERAAGVNDEDIRVFLLGPAFGALIHQIGHLPMHGSSLVKDGKTYLFCGMSGVGKSSLAAVLCERGYQLIADDISVVMNRHDYSSIIPGIRQLKLWQDVMVKLEKDYTQFENVRSGVLRYKVPFTDKDVNENNKVEMIFILERKNTDGFQIFEAKGTTKFELIKKNTYRERYLKGLGTLESNFKQISDLMQNTKVFHLLRPSNPLLLNELADFVEHKIEELKYNPE